MWAGWDDHLDLMIVVTIILPFGMLKLDVSSGGIFTGNFKLAFKGICLIMHPISV